MANLTDKQKRFCEEYIIDLNGTQAAIRAGYSENTANRIASENLSKLDIQEYIQELQSKISDRNNASIDGVIQKLMDWIEADITETINLTGAEIKQLPPEIRSAISSYKHQTSTSQDGQLTYDTVEVKFISKERAIDMLAKHLGFYERDNKQKSTSIDLSKLDTETLLKLKNASSGD